MNKMASAAAGMVLLCLLGSNGARAADREVTGVVYHDRNANARRDPGEPDLVETDPRSIRRSGGHAAP